MKPKETFRVSMNLIKCPFCSKHYRSVKNVNTHITIKHGSKMKLAYPDKPSRQLIRKPVM